MCGQVGRPAEAKVPFTHHVGAVAQAVKGMRNIVRDATMNVWFTVYVTHFVLK